MNLIPHFKLAPIWNFTFEKKKKFQIETIMKLSHARSLQMRLKWPEKIVIATHCCEMEKKTSNRSQREVYVVVGLMVPASGTTVVLVDTV